MREEKEQLSEEKQQLQGVSDRYDRVVRVLGENVVEDAVQKDIQEQKALEEKRQIEQMPKGSIHERQMCIRDSYQRLKGEDVISTPKTKNSVRTVIMPVSYTHLTQIPMFLIRSLSYNYFYSCLQMST